MRHALLLLLATLPACSAPRATLVPEAEATALASRDAEPREVPVANAWTDDARAAVRRALPFVEREGIAWMEGRVPMQGGEPCVSCHHVGYAVWSHAEARVAGIEISEQAGGLTKTAVAFLERPSIPRAMSVGPVLLAEPASAETLVGNLLGLQNAAGSWSAVGQFPSQRRPIEESDGVATMYALLSLAGADAGEHHDTVTASQKNALDWLAEQPPGESVEWLAARLVLVSVLGPDDEAVEVRQQLMARQRADGGWGWSGDDESDPFSTGQALYALATVAADDPTAAERAIRYLIDTQGDDGSWQLPSTTISREPSANKDDIYRFWGTAWATIGLARALRT